MKNILSISVVITTIILLLASPSKAQASTIFFDSFLSGYNSKLWSIDPNQPPPIATDFGIGVNPLFSNSYATLIYKDFIPSQLIIKMDMKINSPIASDMGIFVSNTNTGEWKNAFLFGFGTGGRENKAYLRDSTIWGDPSLYVWGDWDYSQKVHHIEIHISETNSTPITLIEDEKILLSWLSNLNLTANQISLSLYGTGSEISNFELCDSNGCDHIEPTKTPSPIPTLTPTLTPTPTPSSPKKVIVVPGMGGSWNMDALLHCKPSGYNGKWTEWIINNANVYQPLLTKLQQSGYKPTIFYYDWRKPIITTVPILSSFIQSVIQQPNETVSLVGHSMGGLVSSAYLESAQNDSHLDKLLTVGTPHQGSVLAYPAWSGGEMWAEDTNVRLAFTMMQIGCLLNNRTLPRESVQTYIPSFQNLLPVFDYLRNKQTGKIQPVSTMKAKNNWLPRSINAPSYGVTVGAISGTGYQTLQQLEVNTPDRADQRLGNWLDGKPTKNISYADGDGSVLLTSSQLQGSTNISVPLDHAGLVTDTIGQTTIIDFLNGTLPLQLRTLTTQQTNNIIKPSNNVSALLIVAEGAHITLTDKKGNKIQDSDGQITLLNPSNEEYILSATPENRIFWSSKYTVLVVQLFEDGTSKWKQYNRKDIFQKHFKVRFDRKFRHEDVMSEG